jgi:hypothetical protein
MVRGELITPISGRRTLDGRASDNGAELVDRARSDLGSLRNARSPSAGLAARLYRSLTSGFSWAPLLSLA